MGTDFEIFDWGRIFLNNYNPSFLLEVIFRTVVLFLSVLIILRLAGKRGLKQLSIFELAIIIALGSAAGDPMMYPDTPILPAILNFILVIGIYKLITWLAAKYRIFEDIIEGKCECILENGVIKEKKLKIFGYDEFLSELRTLQITHLGQVEKVYLETSGMLSVYYYEDDRVIPGLPIQPEYYNQSLKIIKESGHYSCISCGYTVILEPINTPKICEHCKNDVWLPSLKSKRIT